MSGEVHVHPSHAEDPTGYPPCRVAHSRKVMKGEDKSFAAPGAEWRGVRFDAFGLFDGHGGKDAAEHCAEAFVPALLNALDAPGPIPEDADPEDVFEDRVAEALARAFETVDAQFLARDIHSGATATMCVVNGRHVHSAAVGDSLATLDCGHGCAPVRLTPEHRLDTSAAERRRIEERGGEVRATAFEDGKPVGPLRVWPGGLAVSRSIGDRDGKKGGVSSEPEVSQVLVPDSQPGFRIVLASDGLWDAVTVKQASACGAKLGTGPCAAALCKLAQKQKDNRDDITVMVVDYLANSNDKSPLTSKPPWRTELEVRWPLGRNGRNGRKRYDPVQPASARRKLRVEGDAEAERVEREAIEAARARAAAAVADSTINSTAGANARRLAELEAYERSKASAVDGDDGWEEVGKGHAGRGFESSPPQKSASPPVPKGAKGPGAGKEKKTAERVGKKPGGGRGGRGGDGVKSGRGGGRGGGAHEDVAAAMDGLNIEEPSQPGAKPPLPRPRIDLSSSADDAAPGLEVPTPERAASDSPVDDARSPIKKKSRKGKKERAAERASREAEAADRAVAFLPQQPHHPQPHHPQPHHPHPHHPQHPHHPHSQPPVDHRALLELQHRALAEMHARHLRAHEAYLHGDQSPLAATGHHSPPPPPPPAGAHPLFTPPPHITAAHHAAAGASPVHQGSPVHQDPAPPASPGIGDPPEAGGDGSVAKKPKPKRKGKRERAMERARLAASAGAAGAGGGVPPPPAPPAPPPHLVMAHGHHPMPPPPLPGGMGLGWHPGMMPAPPHHMPLGPWPGN